MHATTRMNLRNIEPSERGRYKSVLCDSIEGNPKTDEMPRTQRRWQWVGIDGDEAQGAFSGTEML